MLLCMMICWDIWESNIFPLTTITPPTMHVNTRPRIVSFALKTLSSAVACAMLLSPAANAAGLGKLTVLSSLGQPLRAEIELTAVAPEEAAGLVAKLAPADAFRVANIDFNPTLLSLHFDVEQRAGRQFIRITSSQPVNEPFVDMLLELNWTGGRLVREYTFLLDPAEMRATQSAQVAAPVDLQNRPGSAAPAAAAPALTQAPAPAPAAAPPAAPAPAPVRARAPETTATKPAAEQYQVKPGDNLTHIASQLKPTDISLDMMLVALYRANPEAFAGNNMNRLKSGQILSVPDADSVRGTSDSEARGVVVAHAADFAAYRAKLAGQVAQSTPAKEPETSQSAAGKITAKVEEHATPANAAKDQLKLSKAGTAAPVAGNTAQAGVEDKIAKEKQVADAAARVKELEKNVSDLEKLMAVKNKAMADKKASASASASAAASAPAPASMSAVAKAAPPVKPVLKMPPKPPRVVEPSLFDTLMDNILYVGAALVALLGIALVVMRRRRAAQPAEPKAETSILGDPGTQAHSLFAETGGQSVDTNNSVFNSNFAPSASQLDTNEVDPVAEADVYIAYGRDAQAEEILKEALRTHPERNPVRLKLLEIYATRKDARAFETQASELYSQTKGQGDDWAQAVALGLTIDPLNPLYSGAAGHGGAAGVTMGEVAAGAVVAAAAGAAAYAAEAPPPAGTDFGADFQAEPASSGLDLDLSQDAAPAAENNMDFNLDQDMATAVPAPSAASEAPTPAAMADAAEADHFLDFDLGGLSFEPVAATAPAIEMPAPEPEPALAAEPAPKAEEPFDLAFDAPAAPAVEAVAAPAADMSMDFGLDLPAEVAAAPLPQVSSDPLADLDLMDFDIPAVPEPSKAAATAEDLSLDHDFNAPATAAPAAPAPAEFDLSGIDLDLSPSSAPSAAPAAAPAAVNEEQLSALHMEMDTKLDLAIAYQEIGDKEGARELLDEVLRGGSDDQVAKANAMRAALG